MSGLAYNKNVNEMTKKIFINLKPGAKLVQEIKGSKADEIFQKEKQGDFFLGEDGWSIDKFRIRKLESGEREGERIVECYYERIEDVKLKSIEITERFNSRQLQMILHDQENDTDLIVTMGHAHDAKTNKYSSSFIDLIPEIDIEKLITIAPFDFIATKDKDNNPLPIEKQKPRKGINIYTDNGTIKLDHVLKYDKNRPEPLVHEMPKSGKKIWDWDPVIDWQDEILKKFMVKQDEKWSNSEDVAKEKQTEENIPF